MVDRRARGGPIAFAVAFASYVEVTRRTRSLATRLFAAQPSLKVLYGSGYTADIIAHHGILDPGLDFLPKPFTADAFASKLRSVLNAIPVPTNSGAGEETKRSRRTSRCRTPPP
jgi:hypothetical protein